MEEYKYDEESVNALVKWAETATFPEQGYSVNVPKK